MSESIEETGSAAIDLATYLPYLIHRLGAWTSPRRALRLADGRIVRLREWRLMMVIATHGRLTGADATYLTAMDSGSTTRAVQALLDDALIVATPCNDDRRRSWLSLTPAGRDVHDELAAQRNTYNARLLRDMPAADRAVLLRPLSELQQRAEHLDRE